MEVIVHIPDSIGERLGKNAEAIPRWLLEKAGLEAYRSKEISGYELRLMLGIPSRLELEAFLKMHGVYLEWKKTSSTMPKRVGSSSSSTRNRNERHYLQHHADQLSGPH